MAQKIPSSQITPEPLYRSRRRFLVEGGSGALALAAWLAVGWRPGTAWGAKDDGLGKLTPYELATSYNNFYELGPSKEEPAKNQAALKTGDWKVRIEGAVERPYTLDMEALAKLDHLERVYRFRCVEGWSMVLPWNGVSLAGLLKKARPTAKARYVAFESVMDPKNLPGQKWNLLPWPYQEGLRLDEAMHPLTLLADGLYGKPLPNQNGAPIRLVVPWKYGFKNIKSIRSIRLVEKTPPTTWNIQAPHEYGFYANVNPAVDHPRWSQAKERPLGQLFKKATLPFNGYQDQVAHLYQGMDLTRYF